MRRAIVLNGGSHCYADDCGRSGCAVSSCGIYQGWYKPEYEVFTAEDYKKQIVNLAKTVLENRPDEYLAEYEQFLHERDTDSVRVIWSISACRDIELLRKFTEYCDGKHHGCFENYVKIAKERIRYLERLTENIESTESSPSQQELFETAKHYNDIVSAEEALVRITDQKLLETLAGGEWDYPDDYYKNKIIRLAKTILKYTPEEYANRYLYLKNSSGGKTDPDFSDEPQALEWMIDNADRELLDNLAFSTCYSTFRELANERRQALEEEGESAGRNEANFKRRQRHLFGRAKNYMEIEQALDATIRIKDNKLLIALAEGEW